MQLDGKKLFLFSKEALTVMFRQPLLRFHETALVEALDEMSEHMEITEEQVQLAMRLGALGSVDRRVQGRAEAATRSLISGLT